MNRRDFLQLSSALALAPRFAGAQDAYRLKAAPAVQHMVGAEHPPTQVWAYNGTVPGPLLRYRQGERLRIEVENAIDFETTVHWHGIRLPNAMDGVPHLTQAPIRKGGRFTYEFDLPDAGTFWYHPHLGSAEQVGRGLAGPLIVEEREPPKVDRDLVWMLSDWRLNEAARITPDFLHPRDSSHNGRIGNTVTVNGRILDSFALRSGERVRLRLVNASNARIYGLRFENHAPWVIALDGHPVTPRLAERIVLGPAQRADLILDCGSAPGSRHRVVDDFYPRAAYRLLEFAYTSEEPLMRTQELPSRLPANPVAVPELAKAERHRIVFGGGAMGAVPDQKAHRGMFWTMNGKPVGEHLHHEPLFSISMGRTVVLEMVNETAWHHPMHLHGHTFRVLSKDGKPADEWGDTVLVEPRGRAEIAFVADNPGDWMLHCHVLEHQATGMMATVRVA
jgi:FtsP/CotA-like multicopper oxidase with cupredoxin domain